MKIYNFSPVLKDNLQSLIKRVQDGFASCIILDGGLGQGKTTLAVEIADEINAYYGHEEVDLTGDPCQLAMGGEQFKRKLLECYSKGYHALVYDEAGDFNNRGFISTFNKELYRTFNIYRAYKIIVILCLPVFTDLDPGIFNLGVIRFNINLKGRNQVRGCFMGYSLRSLIWIRHNISKGKVVSAFSRKGINPNFYGIFYNLPLPRAKLLEVISTGAKLNTSKEMSISNIQLPRANINIKGYKDTIPQEITF